MAKVDHESDGNSDSGPALTKVNRVFGAVELCDTILNKILKLGEDLGPVLRVGDETTPDARESSLLMERLQDIDGHLDKLIDRIDL